MNRIKQFLLACPENDYKPGILKPNLLALIIVGLIFLKFISLPFLVKIQNSNYFADITRQIIIDLANEERKDLGLKPLVENNTLNIAASYKAGDMLVKDYFSHFGPGGVSPWYWFSYSGYKYSAAGENLGIGYLESREIHNAWIDSPSHRANIINPLFEEIGIGIIKGDFQGNEATVVVQLFGTPHKTVIIPTDNEKLEREKYRQELIINQEIDKIEDTEDIKEVNFDDYKYIIERPDVLGESLLIGEMGEEKRDYGMLFKLFKFLVVDYGDILWKVTFVVCALLILFLSADVLIILQKENYALVVKGIIFVASLSSLLYIHKNIFNKLFSITGII